MIENNGRAEAGNNEFYPLERYNKEPANKLQPWQQKRKGSSRVESRSSGDIEDENWSMVGWPRRRQ